MIVDVSQLRPQSLIRDQNGGAIFGFHCASRWDEVAGTLSIFKKSEIYVGDKKAQITMNKNRKGIDCMIE